MNVGSGGGSTFAVGLAIVVFALTAGVLGAIAALFGRNLADGGDGAGSIAASAGKAVSPPGQASDPLD